MQFHVPFTIIAWVGYAIVWMLLSKHPIHGDLLVWTSLFTSLLMKHVRLICHALI